MDSQLIKNNLKKVFVAPLSVTLPVLISLIQLLLSNAQAGNIQLVLSLANECFNSRERQICLNAIGQVEEFQLISGSKDNYSCQTRLLGLESQLIMVILNKQKKTPYESALNDAYTFCDQFH